MSTSHENPFPGMNPYFEGMWSDVHASMIVYCRSQLQSQLPEGLRAHIETGLMIDAEDEGAKRRRPDAGVWTVKEDAPSYGAVAVLSPPANAVAPIMASSMPPKRRVVTVRETSDGGRLVTAIEFLSPSNKRGSGAVAYQVKRDAMMAAGVNLVEIDLVRDGGLAACLFDGDNILAPLRSRQAKLPPHLVCVIHAHASEDSRAFYPITYQQELPSFAIPLRAGDKDVWLNLQESAARCFVDGGFSQTDYSKNPQPTLSNEDAVWLDDLLKSKRLR